MKNLILVFVVVLSCGNSISAQSTSSNKSKKVLIVPFERFEFHTELNLAEINAVNGLEKDQFYPAMLDIFIKSFTLNSNEHISYYVISPADFKDLMKVVYHDFKGGHYRARLDDLSFSSYHALLEKYNCDFMLSVNWYKIGVVRKSYKINKVKEYGKYGTHLIDYDLFNANKISIFEKTALKFEVDQTDKNYNKKGVWLNDLPPLYKKMVDGISVDVLEQIK